MADGQGAKDDIAGVEQQAQEQGGTFTVGENAATRYSLSQLCGLKKPANWMPPVRREPMGAPLASLPSAFDWRRKPRPFCGRQDC